MHGFPTFDKVVQHKNPKFFFGQNPSTTSPDMGLKGGLVKKSLAVALAAVSKGHTSKRAVFGGKSFDFERLQNG